MSECECCNGKTLSEVEPIFKKHRLFLNNGDETYTEIKFKGCQPKKDDLHFEKGRTLTHREYEIENNIGVNFLVLKTWNE